MLQCIPISLCNVFYKIATRVLPNRLKMILSVLISEEQSAFVPERLVRKRNKKKYLCVVKLNMMKSYNRLEWVFLEYMMYKMGFAPMWIDIIMTCVTTASFTVKLNGGFFTCFLPSRGFNRATRSPLIYSIFLWKGYPHC